jgi:hypothetical protein
MGTEDSTTIKNASVISGGAMVGEALTDSHELRGLFSSSTAAGSMEFLLEDPVACDLANAALIIDSRPSLLVLDHRRPRCLRIPVAHCSTAVVEIGAPVRLRDRRDLRHGDLVKIAIQGSTTPVRLVGDLGRPATDLLLDVVYGKMLRLIPECTRRTRQTPC